jgi:hypothetical protein
MSARQGASSVVYIASAADEKFLASTAEALDRLHRESEHRGHRFLASLLSIAKGEAEDGANTLAKNDAIRAREPDRDDGAALMARKLTRRATV